jgi:hypothetical protein
MFWQIFLFCLRRRIKSSITWTLDRHSKKAVAPIIILGYFRDVLKLGSHLGGDISIEKTIEESRNNVKKVGKAKGCIPR